MIRKRNYTQYLTCLKHEITPTSTLIAFDLHNVLFKTVVSEIIINSLKLIPRGTWRYILNARFWYVFYRMRAQTNVAEDLFEKVAVYYPAIKSFRDEFIMLSNAQVPIKPMVELLQILKDRGFILYVLSNIGKETYEQLFIKYPEILSIFDGAYIPSQENAYSHKPHLVFYEQFKHYIAQQGHEHKQILFIDDIKKNLSAALSLGIGGIEYKSYKQIYGILKYLNII